MVAEPPPDGVEAELLFCVCGVKLHRGNLALQTTR
jgi:hypothetical protein